MNDKVPAKKAKKKKLIDNEKFTAEVIAYSRLIKQIKAENEDIVENQRNVPQTELPVIPQYIGESIWKLCDSLARRPNFSQYSFRDLMIGDAIEDCIKAVSRGNYDPNAETRSKKPNAHAYFSQCAYWAMVRRIQKEEKEVRTRMNLINSHQFGEFITAGDSESYNAVQATVEKLRGSYSEVAKTKAKASGKHYGWSAPKSRGKRAKSKSLEQFME